jgi:hypothetical protein
MPELVSGDALLLVDVQRDFCPGGALPGPRARAAHDLAKLPDPIRSLSPPYPVEVSPALRDETRKTRERHRAG